MVTNKQTNELENLQTLTHMEKRDRFSMILKNGKKYTRNESEKKK